MFAEGAIKFVGVVGQGLERGRQLGFPTANLEVAETAAEGLPRGVFAGRLRWEGEDWQWAVVNIGYRPTFGVSALSIEAHVIDYAGDLYGKVLEVELQGYLRGEMRFANAKELVAQIVLDVENARYYLGSGAINNTMEV